MGGDSYRFMHFGDTHLGRKQPSRISQQRVDSSLKALEHCIEKAVEEELDFIVHAGDFFDTIYPWHTVIDRACDVLKSLEEHGIPLYCIRGNHDRSYGRGRTLKGLAIEHLENEYVRLIDPSPEEFAEEGFIDHDENIRIYGLGYHSRRTPEILQDFEPPDDRFNILLLHDFVDGVTRKYSDKVAAAKDIAEKNVHYVGIGHDHQPNPGTRIKGTVFAATGGTIDYDFNTTSFDKCYNLVEVQDQNLDIETRQIPQELELRNLTVSLENAELNPIRQRIEHLRNGNNIALKIKITGEAGESEPSEIPTGQIARSIEQEFKDVLMAEVILDLKVKGYTGDDEEHQKFSIEQNLREKLEDEMADKMVSLHERTDAAMANDENLTPSGFNLKKQVRQELQRKAEEELF